MKKVLAFAIAFLVMLSLLADVITPQPSRRRRPQGIARETGGLVISHSKGNVIRIVSSQSRVNDVVLEAVSRSITLDLWLPVELEKIERNGLPARQLVANAFRCQQTGIAVVLVDEEGVDSIVTSPEGGWAIVNIHPLCSDNPEQAKLNARVGKEIWRAFAFAAGAGFSASQPCVLQQTTEMVQLDAISMPVPSPEQHNKLIDCSKARGILPIRLGTYRTACQQGWAPFPTNDIQRTIWQEVQAEKERGPTTPLKIIPPSVQK